MTTRMFPPSDGRQNPPTIVANGRTYSCAVGNYIDVPDQDAFIMAANGWTFAVHPHSGGLVGPTSARPTAPFGAAPGGAAPPARGTHFLDTTVGAVIVFDGASWRNPATGAAV